MPVFHIFRDLHGLFRSNLKHESLQYVWSAAVGSFTTDHFCQLWPEYLEEHCRGQLDMAKRGFLFPGDLFHRPIASIDECGYFGEQYF